MGKKKEKKKICAKCGLLFWIDIHHILPKSTFGGRGETVNLCPNCHRDYHENLGKKNLKNPDEAFHYAFFARWMAGLLAVGVILWISLL